MIRVDVKKFIRSVLIVLVIIGVFSLFLISPSLSHSEVEYKTIYVMQGETLWCIASELRISNNYYQGKDVRYIVNDLVTVNDLSSKTLSVNQSLQIPTM
ncbi:MAG: hypothetical protein FWC79_00815 [Oscillospiraceae bacterium]|nr:hypothetical protein [Oscillospiraceae bacterium]